MYFDFVSAQCCCLLTCCRGSHSLRHGDLTLPKVIHNFVANYVRAVAHQVGVVRRGIMCGAVALCSLCDAMQDLVCVCVCVCVFMYCNASLCAAPEDTLGRQLANWKGTP